MKQQSKSYQISYGWIRIIACIFVIAHHCGNTIYAGSINEFDKKAVLIIDDLLMVNNGLFFMLSGKFALEYFNGNITLYYKKRVKRIILPFLLVIFLKRVVWNKIGITDFFNQFFHGKITDWFVYAVIGFYLIAPFFYRMFQNMSEKYKLAFLILILVLAFINSINECYKPLFYVGTNPFIGNLSFFIIGYLLDNIKKLRPYKWHIVLLGIISSCISVFEIVNFPGHNPSIYGFCPTRIFMCMGIYVLIGWNEKQVNDIVKKVTIHIADLTYYIYLVHEVGQDLIFSHIPFTVTNVYIGLLWTTFGTFAISLLFAEILNFLFKSGKSKK